jgi:hypothetical protein
MIMSTLCALHCAAIALLPALLPGFVGVGWLENALMVAAMAVGASAILAAFVRVHRDPRPLLLLAGGIALLLTRAALGERPLVELVCSVSGAGLIVAAHVSNSRTCRCRCCPRS